MTANTEHAKHEYSVYAERWMLCEYDERYVERREDEGRTEPDWYVGDFGALEEAVEAMKAAAAGCDDPWCVVRTKRGLDTVTFWRFSISHFIWDDEYEQWYVDEDFADYGVDTLPEDVREKAFSVQRGYHDFLDWREDSYSSLADEL